MKILKELWHGVLVYWGLRPCCDNQKIREIVSTPEYYSYECLNCGNIKSGGGFSRML
jgi:hypothetical protein